jgi:hypothetical protein
VLRIRITLMRIRILPLTFFPALDPQMFQDDPLKPPPFHFDADPDPAYYFYANPYLYPDPAFQFKSDPDLASQNDPDL